MKNLRFFLILSVFIIFQTYSEETNDAKLTFKDFMTEPIYGEENAPSHIYYKFIHNSPSEGFFYYQHRLEDDMGTRLTLFFIIPQRGDDSIFLIYLEDFEALYQYSIVYNPHELPFSRKTMLYSSKYFLENSLSEFVDINELYPYFIDHLEFNYKLIYKTDLELLLDSIVPHNTRVYIDKIDLSDPKYVREHKK